MIPRGTPTPAPIAALLFPYCNGAGDGNTVADESVARGVADELVDIDGIIEYNEELGATVELDDMETIVEVGFTPIVVRADG